MIELTKNFVAATDNVTRLQRGTDPERIYFQNMANQGHYGGREGSTRQGIYVCSPSGKFLASINTTNPDRVLQMMHEGLKAWNELPVGERQLKAEGEIKPRQRWDGSFPEDGLVLNVISRDLPEQCDPAGPCEVKWNQDYAWFSKNEARQWLGNDPQPGDVHSLPENLVARLARFQFVDNVKGETPRFSRAGVKGSQISVTVGERIGSLVKLRISGATQGVAPEGWWQSANGVVTRLVGQAEFDLSKGEFVEFEMVALGRRWGHTRFNGRRHDPQSGPLGYVFRLADPDSPRIAPAQITSYDAEWIIRPTRR